MHAKSLQFCLTLCDTVDCSPPGSPVHGFSRQGYWSGLSCPPARHFPYSGMEPMSLISPALAGSFFTSVPPEKPKTSIYTFKLKTDFKGNFLSFDGLS